MIGLSVSYLFITVCSEIHWTAENLGTFLNYCCFSGYILGYSKWLFSSLMIFSLPPNYVETSVLVQSPKLSNIESICPCRQFRIERTHIRYWWFNSSTDIINVIYDFCIGKYLVYWECFIHFLSIKAKGYWEYEEEKKTILTR